MSAIDRLLDRLREARTARARELRAGGAAPRCAEDRLGCRFRPGDRVFDLVSGEEGEVLGSTIEHVVVPAPGRREG